MFVNSSFLPVHNQVIDDIVIVDSEDENLMPAGKKLTSDTLAKIDEILYADIGKLHKMDKVDKVRILVFCVWIFVRSHQHTYYEDLLFQVSSNFMSEVDKILSLGTSAEEPPGKVIFFKLNNDLVYTTFQSRMMTA